MMKSSQYWHNEGREGGASLGASAHIGQTSSAATERKQAQRSSHSQAAYTREDFEHSPLLVFYEVTRACDLV
ncbi:MAG: hypothetical protein ACP5UB_12435, partial [Candidatus Sumerlaeaceae bacterium]